LIQFDFEDRYANDPTVGSSSSRREGAYLSLVLHALVVALLLFAPQIPWFQPSAEELEQQRLEALRQEQEERQRQRFVFVQPRIDTPAPTPPPRPELSDLDRRAQAPEVSRQPDNPLPFSRGNSTERTEAPAPERAQVEEPAPAPEPPAPEPEQPKLEARLPDADRGLRRPLELPNGTTGNLRDALRDLNKYVQSQTFNNPQGGSKDPGQAIQFDTKGVEFGPWIRRFVQRVRRNWFVPEAAFSFRGRVVLQFNIHRDGHITDLAVVQPSEIAAFNRAAQNAILGSNPVEPLPPEYPDDRAFFTVTFYYNESPDN
jgi:TonB family protein